MITKAKEKVSINRKKCVDKYDIYDNLLIEIYRLIDKEITQKIISEYLAIDEPRLVKIKKGDFEMSKKKMEEYITILKTK